jgi:hypothetical protein
VVEAEAEVEMMGFPRFQQEGVGGERKGWRLRDWRR